MRARGSKVNWTTFLRAAVLCFVLVGCSAEPQAQSTGESLGRRNSGLLDSVRQAFTAKNPRIVRSRILEIRPNPAQPAGAEYAVLATGTAPNQGDEIDFTNELYGVFVTDSTLTRVLRVLDIFTTQRWGDYSVRFEPVGFDSLVVVGSGIAHGDQPLRRRYDWARRGE